MNTHKIGVISLSVIGVAAVLMVVTAPTFENQALAVSQPVVKKVSVKDPTAKVKKDPPRKRFRCALWRGKRCVRWVPIHFRGPVFRHPGIRPPIGTVRPPMGIRPPIGTVRPSY
jgi:hypothetical protein